jgi:hypothetical protein
MSNKVSDTLAAAATNFKSSATRQVEQQQISKADALGISPPQLTPDQKEGYRALATLARQDYQEKTEAHAKYQRERAEYERAADDAAWQRILRRRRAAL